MIPNLSKWPGLCLHPVPKILSHKPNRSGACYSMLDNAHQILVRAPSLRLSASMSLYRAGLKLAFFLPLGVAIPNGLGFADVSPVFTLPLRVKATLVDRTRVRKSSADGSTCLADSINLTWCYPNGREDAKRF